MINLVSQSTFIEVKKQFKSLLNKSLILLHFTTLEDMAVILQCKKLAILIKA